MREVRRRGSILNATFNTAFAIALTGFASAAYADPIPQGWEASNMTPIGYSALENRRGAFKMTLKKATNGRWYMYLGHLWHRGWTIVDVTDPKNPTFVKHIPGAAQHLDHPGDVARQHPGHGVAERGGRLGPRREGAIRRGRADLGHQRSGQSRR